MQQIIKLSFFLKAIDRDKDYTFTMEEGRQGLKIPLSKKS